MYDYNKQQKSNTIKAYNNNDKATDYLSEIVNQSIEVKTNIKEFFNGTDTLTFNFPVDNDTIADSDYRLRKEVYFKYDDLWSFAFHNNTVTNRATGKCYQLKKWFKDHFFSVSDINYYLSTIEANKYQTIILSCNPWFLIGSSCMYNGRQLDSSCHWPGSQHDYASGAISYSLDKHTVLAGIWNANGLIGRMLIHLDLNNEGFVTSRLYGEFKESHSTFIRKELYKLFKCKEFKKTKAFTVYANDYSGYQDTGYYVGYRKNQEKIIEINLTAAICPECGEHHSNGNLICSSCDSSKYKCSCCGDRLHEDDIYSTDYDVYCEHCFYESFSYCNHCGEAINNEDIINCDNEYYCEHCARRKNFYECYDCNQWHHIDDMVEFEGDLYCEGCLPEGSHCYDCGEYHRSEDLTEFEGDLYCEDCLPEEENESEEI